MKVLLVWPAVDNLQLYNFLPLGLGYIAANLPKAWEVKLWDGVVDRASDNSDLAKCVAEFQPDIVGISVWSFNLPAALDALRVLHEVRNSSPRKFPIIGGGPAVTAYKKSILSRLPLDFAIAGEGEFAFSAFLEHFRLGTLNSASLGEIPGMIYKNEAGDIQANAQYKGSLDEIRYCDYSRIRLKDYLRQGYRYGSHTQAKRTAPILTTRGCPYPCEYCSAPLMNGRVLRARPVDSVIQEILELHEHYGVDGFNIIDDNFTLKLDYAKSVCRAIIALGKKEISFNNPNGVRIEKLDEELLALMKAANWECLFVAPESGSERTLKNMRKLLNLETVHKNVAMIKRHGLKVFGFFMIGYPGETPQDIRETFRFSRKVPFDFVVYSCFQPLTGTKAHEKLVESGEVRDAPEGVDYYQVSYAPMGMTLRQMRMLRFWGLLRFYTSSHKRLANLFGVYSLKRMFIFAKKIAFS